MIFDIKFLIYQLIIITQKLYRLYYIVGNKFCLFENISNTFNF